MKKEELRQCMDCNGYGFYQGYADEETHFNGDCVECPIAVKCEACRSTGYLTQVEYDKIVKDRSTPLIKDGDIELPF